MTITTESFLAIGVGTSANDGTGDSLREAFVKVNNNFSNISDIGFDAGNIAVTGDVDTTGNVDIGGATVYSGYQHYQPIGNIAITANTRVSHVTIAPTSDPMISFWVDATLPNTSVDGTTVSFSSNVAVGTFRALPGWGIYSVDPSANTSIAAGEGVTYLLNTTAGKWFKIR
jgi:hypothetical protein